MKFKELSQMSKEERRKKLNELQLELIKLNAQVATGTPPKNSGQLKRLKKDIAKIMLLRTIDEKVLAQRRTHQTKSELQESSKQKNKLKKEHKNRIQNK